MSWEDIKSVDHSIFNYLEGILKMGDKELKSLDQSFIGFLFDGSEVELKPKGRRITLRYTLFR